MFTTVFPPVLTPIPRRQADVIYVYIYDIFYISYLCIVHTNIFIYTYQGGGTPLHYAADLGHGKIVETLVQAKADVCAQDELVSVLKETRLDADRGMR